MELSLVDYFTNCKPVIESMTSDEIKRIFDEWEKIDFDVIAEEKILALNAREFLDKDIEEYVKEIHKEIDTLKNFYSLNMFFHFHPRLLFLKFLQRRFI